MKNFNLGAGEQTLVIVAHPDDETIWMGGTILMHPKARWTIFSLCRAGDKDRSPKFFRVCRRYKARPAISDLEDEDKLEPESAKREAKELILRQIKNKKIKYIFTHGKNGEYGHPKHIAVSRAVSELAEEKRILPQAVFYFNYKKAKPGNRPSMEAKKDSDILIRLPQKVFTEKKIIQSRMYGYPMDGIDVGYCTNPESFKINEYNANAAKRGSCELMIGSHDS